MYTKKVIKTITWYKKSEPKRWCRYSGITKPEAFKLLENWRYQCSRDLNLLEELYNHLHTKAIKTAWETKEDCEKFSKILNKVEKRLKQPCVKELY